MHYQLNPDVLLQNLDGETILLEPTSGYYYSLDSVGSQMINEYKLSNSVSAVVDAMTEVYDVAPELVEQDLLDLLERLCHEGLACKS